MRAYDPVDEKSGNLGAIIRVTSAYTPFVRRVPARTGEDEYVARSGHDCRFARDHGRYGTIATPKGAYRRRNAFLLSIRYPHH